MRYIKALLIFAALVLCAADTASAWNIKFHGSMTCSQISKSNIYYIYRSNDPSISARYCDSDGYTGADMPFMWGTYPMEMHVMKYPEGGRYQLNSSDGLGNLMQGYDSSNGYYSVGITPGTGDYYFNLCYTEATATVNVSATGTSVGSSDVYYYQPGLYEDYLSGSSITVRANYLSQTSGNIKVRKFLNSNTYWLKSATGTGALAGKNMMSYESGGFYGSETVSFSQGTTQTLSLTYGACRSITVSASGLPAGYSTSGFSPVPSAAVNYYDLNASVTLNAPSSVTYGGIRYVLTGWSGSGSVPATGASGSTTFGITANSAITWNYKRVHDITVATTNLPVGAPTTGFSPAPGTVVYDYNSSVTLSAPPVVDYGGSHYVCTGWSGGSGDISVGGASTSTSFTCTQNGGISWTYKRTQEITVGSSGLPGGFPTAGFDPLPGTGSYDYSVSRTFSAPTDVYTSASAHYVLTGWTGIGGAPASGAGSQTSFAPTADGTITWNYKQVHGLTVSVDGLPAELTTSGFSPAVGYSQHDRSSQVTLTAPLSVDRFDLDGWTSGSGDVPFTGGTPDYTISSIANDSTIKWVYVGDRNVTVSVSGLPSDLLSANLASFTPQPGDTLYVNRSSVSLSAPLVNDLVNQCYYKVRSFIGTGAVPGYIENTSQYTIADIRQDSSITWVYEKVYKLEVDVEGLDAALVGPSAKVGNKTYTVQDGAVYIRENSSVSLSTDLRKFARPEITTGNSPFYSASADFNGDGLPDLAVTNYDDATLSVFLGSGDGTFIEAGAYPTGAGPAEVTAIDMDNDLDMDIAVANKLANSVSVFLGAGDGSFTAGTTLSVGEQPHSIVGADFDLDNNADLAVSCLVPNTVSILRGNGDGSFDAPVDFATPDEPANMARGDFNADGYTDLAVPCYHANKVAVLINNQSGGFQAALQIDAGDNPHSVASADFDGDGNLDFAAVNRNAHTASVMRGNGDGTFTAKVAYAVGRGPVFVVAEDFDGDGKADLATTNCDDDTVTLLMGKAGGVFGARQDIMVGDYPRGAAPGDYNVDGLPDLAVANFYSDAVTLLVSDSAAGFREMTTIAADGKYAVGVATGDFNRDGRQDIVKTNCTSADKSVSVILGNGDGTFSSQVYVPVGIVPNYASVADLNGDGHLDIVTSDAGTSNNGTKVSVLLGNGDGTFQPFNTYNTGVWPVTVTPGDFDNDGSADLVTANLSNQTVSVLFGSGDGTFPTNTNLAGGGFATVGDLNGDGYDDIAAGNSSTNKLVVLLSNGAIRSFKAKAEYAAGNGAQQPAIGDFNGDGRNDVAVPNISAATVSVFINKGAGTFNQQAVYAVGDSPQSVMVEDFNGDGLTDLLVINRTDDTVSVLLGVGDGTFQPRSDYAVGDQPVYGDTADFDADGLPDIVTANLTSKDVSVLLAGGPTLRSNYMDMVCVSADVRVGDANGSLTYLSGTRLLLPVYLNMNTKVVWKYRGARKWVVGRGIKPPVVSDQREAADIRVVIPGRSDDSPESAFYWSSYDGKHYPVRDVPLVVLSWTNGITGQPIEVPGFTVWPQNLQTHIAKVPAILQPLTNPYTFAGIKFSENDSASATQGSTFKANTPGRSVLMFEDASVGDTSHPVAGFVVVDTVDYTSRLTNKSWSIGTELTDIDHADPEGRTGYVYFPNAYYDGDTANVNRALLDREERQGQIIPVNKNEPYDPSKQLVVIWYETDGNGVGWPVKPVKYNCSWPSGPDTIVIASGEGSGALPSEQKTGHIYYQADRAKPGYNPNEEHAMQLGGQVYALRNDLNNKVAGSGGTATNGTTSEPYVLLKYRKAATGKWAMHVFAVTATDALNNFTYQKVVGDPLLPPMPLDVLPQMTGSNRVSSGADWLFTDHKGGRWVKAALRPEDQDYPAALVMKWYYPLQKGFYYPWTVDGNGNPITEGSPIPLLNGGSTRDAEPVDVAYSLDWPASASTLPIGETLTSARYGLPDLVNMAAARVVFDESVYGGGGPAVRLYDPYSTRAVSLPNGMPTGIVTEDAGSGQKSFPDIPFVLKVRLGYDQANKMLYFRGTTYDPGTGEPLVLPNVMTRAEKEYLQSLDSSDDAAGWASVTDAQRLFAVRDCQSWDKAVEMLYFRSRDPQGAVENLFTSDIAVLSNPYNRALDATADTWLENYNITGLGSAPSPAMLRNSATGEYWIEITPGVWLEARDNTRGPEYWDVDVSGVWKTTKWEQDVDYWCTEYSCVEILGEFRWVFDQNNDGYFETSAAGMGITAGVPAPSGPEVQTVSQINSAGLSGVPMALSAGAAQGEGYVVLVENDEDELGDAPVALHVINVGGGPYVGEVKVIDSDSIFDEKLTLRHTGDFGGQPEKFYFVWYYKPDADGLAPRMPSGPADTDGWVVCADGPGMLDYTISGANRLTLTDNWFMVHYYYNDPVTLDPQGHPGYPTLAVAPNPQEAATPQDDLNNWSGWAGAPGGQSAMLAEGWLKRVMAKLNPLDSRVDDFRNNATNTLVSMISQLGERYEGDIALNSDPDNLNGVGLIEAYQTLLNRAMDFSVDAGDDYGPANVALLNAATRISDFYTLLGNEAYADALDPTIGFDSSSSEYGPAAPTIFCFQNQLDSLLDEELALMRGRDDTFAGTRTVPVYNRLFWNFTRGEGEVAYTTAYNVSDRNTDGFMDELDAAAMFPQGHGDAWGHYLTAIDLYYLLLTHPNFTWEPRIESVLVGGTPVPVDYLDERKFARVAAAKAKVGAEVVDLTYRESYVDDPAGQWQGYKDTDTDRAWGMDGWARRAGQGAYFDWVTANALLPSEDPNPAHTGIQKVDRTTVPELDDIAAQFGNIQAEMDQADKGLNPLGLAKGVVPFDIDPSLLDLMAGTEAKTHFEQVYDRAVKAVQNAVTVFDYANNYTRMLRDNEDTLTDFQRGVNEQETDYRNRLIEVFGYPYSGDIGSADGCTYPAGYDGPDVFHFQYMTLPELVGNDDYPLSGDTIRTYSVDFDMNAKDWGIWDTLDPNFRVQNEDTLTVDYALDTANPWIPADAAMGSRRAPGEIQFALSELIKAHAAYMRGFEEYKAIRDNIDTMAELLQDKYDVYRDKISVRWWNQKIQWGLDTAIMAAYTAQKGFESLSEVVKGMEETAETALPKMVGMSNDITSGIRAAFKGASKASEKSLAIAANAADVMVYGLGQQKGQEDVRMEMELEVDDMRLDVQQSVKELTNSFNDLVVKRQELYILMEEIQQDLGKYQSALASGERLMDELTRFRKNTAADVQDYRYQDLAFRTFRNDAIQKYRSQFDLAARYVYLAATAYDYETNLLGSDNGSGSRFLADIIRQRSIGELSGGNPVAGYPGLADPLARLSMNFGVYKTQMGFNNPQIETNRFSLRSEMFRLKDSSDDAWREALKECRVDDLWRVREFKKFCRPFAPETYGPQPGLVIPFSTEIVFGKNFFGWELAGGDSAYDPTNFATKIRSVGVWFDKYNASGLSNTPRVYLVPVGADVLRSPSGNGFATREWRVVDQKLPVPFPIGASDLTDPGFIPANDTLSDELGGIRRYSSFRAYHDSGEFSSSETVSDSRLVGRSVWNTRWLMIIPGGTLLYDSDQGLDTFIDTVKDIKFFFQTYAYSGN